MLKTKISKKIVEFGRQLEKQDIRNECIWVVWTEKGKERVFNAVFSNSAKALLWLSEQMTEQEFTAGAVLEDGWDRYYRVNTKSGLTYCLTLWGYDCKQQDPQIAKKLYDAIYQERKI